MTVLSKLSLDEELLWNAVLARRDTTAFFFAVKTTGIYCRPSCPARRPLRRNVVFFETGQEAQTAGFRPCRRCRPDLVTLAEEQGALVERACRIIEAAPTSLSLAELAHQLGVSPFHFHRLFKSKTGTTPHRYAQALRRRVLQRDLKNAGSITRAVTDAGYSSSSRFYEEKDEVLGMTPTQFRAGGAQVDIVFAVAPCSLGYVLVARSKRGLCALFLGEDQEHLAASLKEKFPQAQLTSGDEEFDRLVTQVVHLVDDPTLCLELPLDIQGTAFQQRVWQALREIPYGETVSYGEVARSIGKPGASRAVGSACGANLLAIVIPCHRVVHSDGSTSGYRWGGADVKNVLLAREGVK